MNRRRQVLFVLAALLGWGELACRSADGTPPAAAAGPGGAAIAISGTWGGAGIALEVTPDGAPVEFDCAHGTIDRRIEPDRRGCFDLPGIYVEEMGGPVRETPSAGYPARYSGCVEHDVLELTVRRSSDGEVLGMFSLTAGEEPSLVKCR